MRWSLSGSAVTFAAAFLLAIPVATLAPRPVTQIAKAAPQDSYLGFDRNEYPGDDLMPALRRSFSFAGYWLNNPPGARSNSWAGKRSALLRNDFGFLLLFNGRLDRELRRAADPNALGTQDAHAAMEAAQREGFPSGAVIFLDQEEGGRLLPEQLAFVLGWVDGVNSAGFGAGVYCSGMPTKESGGRFMTTANDIRDHAGARPIVFFIYNDACPPSPGCAFPRNPPSPSTSGSAFASVWQFAQSPRRREFTRACSLTYDHDGNCYLLGAGQAAGIDLDLDSATSPDPSNGRP